MDEEKNTPPYSPPSDEVDELTGVPEPLKSKIKEVCDLGNALSDAIQAASRFATDTERKVISAPCMDNISDMLVEVLINTPGGKCFIKHLPETNSAIIVLARGGEQFLKSAQPLIEGAVFGKGVEGN